MDAFNFMRINIFLREERICNSKSFITGISIRIAEINNKNCNYTLKTACDRLCRFDCSANFTNNIFVVF